MLTLARRTRAALLALALAAALAGCATMPAGTAERPTVLSFEIAGAQAVSEDELRAVLVTQPSAHSWLGQPEPAYLDPDALANDRRRIARYYQDRGYYHAEVVDTQVQDEGPGKVRVRLRVLEGPPARVTEIRLEGMDAAPEARAGLRDLPLATGQIFTVAAYDAARAQVEKVLHDTGWARATVTAHARVDPDRDEVHVTYEVQPGARYRFGAVFVAGAAAIPRDRIRKEAELAIRPGEIFDESQLGKAQERVFLLGAFGGVRVAEGTPDEARHIIPVVVTVREAPFRTIRAGPGLTLEANNRWEVDGMAGWSHRNWLGDLRKLNLDLRAGYAWVPPPFLFGQSGDTTTVSRHDFVGLAAADFTQPEILTRYLDLNVHAEVEHGLEQAYRFWAERIRVGLPLRLGRVVSFVPSVNFEVYQLYDQVSGQIDPTSNSQLYLTTCPGHDPNRCVISYLEQRLVVDLRDDPINTRNGLYLGLSVQEGFQIGGNGVKYLRVLPEARAFVSPWRDVVLASRVRLGYVDSAEEDLPLPTMLLSGGYLMRGYYSRQLAPTLDPCILPGGTEKAKDCSKDLVPIGGRSLIDGGAELRFPIIGQLGGATFLDFGHVAWGATDAFDLSKLQYAAGVGLRYHTIFGPLRVDFAYGLNNLFGSGSGVETLRLDPIPNDPTRSTLNKTGETIAQPKWTLQLAIGEAF